VVAAPRAPVHRRIDADDRVEVARSQKLWSNPLKLPSRRLIFTLTGLFTLDSFAGALFMQSLAAYWFYTRFGLSLQDLALVFSLSNVLAAVSLWLAAKMGNWIGLINTMVFTHIPSSLFLIAAALAPGLEVALGFLLARSALSQMDVPARSAYVMSVVTPPERPAAASFTAVPRSLASALGPSLAGAMFAAGAMAAPLVACGLLKIAYDVALYAAFRRVAPRH